MGQEKGECDRSERVFVQAYGPNLLPPAISATRKPCLTACSDQGFIASLYFMEIIHSL